MSRDSSVFVHEAALCESDDIGAGTRVWAFAHVMKGAHIGADCNICDSSFVEGAVWIGDRVVVKNGAFICDKVRIEDEVFVGAHVVFINDSTPRVAAKTPPELWRPTRIARGATLGANSTILCDLEVGAHAFVGAGSVVTRDVPPHALVVGNPARRIGWACECGERLAEALHCGCGRSYELVDERRGLLPRSQPG